MKRTGDAPTRARVVLYLEHFPEQYKVSPELGEALCIKEDSRIGVIQALWNYIKIHSLQDKTDRRIVRADEKLLSVSSTSYSFSSGSLILARYLAPIKSLSRNSQRL